MTMLGWSDEAEKNLIEINERHAFYVQASKGDYLQSFVLDVALTQIANDYCEGNFIAFNRVYNELARLASASNKKTKLN